MHHTAEAMARGGIYDQVGGGFHRYAVDGHWTVPHFEKMLYDNALLLRVYTQLWRLTDDPMAGRIAGETYGFLVHRMTTPEGGFFSSWDADTEGVEGTTYVWTPEQLVEVLGEEDGAFAADLFDVTAEGSFEHGSSVLRLARDIDEADPEVRERWRRVRRALAEVREQRPQPATDDKVIASWAGMAITAMCEYVQVEGAMDGDHGWRPEELIAPIRAAALLARVHLVESDGDVRLRRVSLAGVVGQPVGVLEDYGCVAEAFCAVHQLTGDPRWLSYAEVLLEVAMHPVRRRRRGFLRHRRRRRAARHPPGRPDRQRHPERSGLDGVRAGHLCGADRVEPASRGRRGRAGPGRAADHAASTLRGRLGRRGGSAAQRSGRDRHRHRRPGARAGHDRDQARAARCGDRRGRGDKPGVALLAGRPMIQTNRRRTSAAASSAIGP